jgi:uncharacterized membrane protein YkgB
MENRFIRFKVAEIAGRQIAWAMRAVTRDLAISLARAAMFVIFVWFGSLKVLGCSPAEGMVRSIVEQILPKAFCQPAVVGLGLYEILVGVSFVISSWEDLGVILVVPLMCCTFLPMILLPAMTWSARMTPTMEGQFIIKNVAIVALTAAIIALRRAAPPSTVHSGALRPLANRRRRRSGAAILRARWPLHGGLRSIRGPTPPEPRPLYEEQAVSRGSWKNA